MTRFGRFAAAGKFWLMLAALALSAAVIAGPLGSSLAAAQEPEASPSDVAEPPAPSPSDAVEAPAPSPSDAPPPIEEPSVEIPADEPKPSCCATCRPRPLARLRARLRCCVERLRCRCAPVQCCEPAAEDVPACAPAGSAAADEPAPVQFVSETKEPDEPEAADETKQGGGPPKSGPYAFKPIFDGKTLEDWKAPEFGGEGVVKVEDGQIVMEMGADMTGVTYQGEVPKTNYEIAFEARRLKGNDFFATTTFRVGKDPLTFVVGGWGGTVVGLSNVDFYDASDNMTTKFHQFEGEKWYTIRIRVTDAKVECWIDDEKMVNQHRDGHKFDIRWECELCKPLGISTWCTSSAIKNIRMRKLSPKEVEAAAEAAKKEKNEPSFG